MKILKEKFRYVNSDITSDNFPKEKIRGKVKIVDIKDTKTSEEIIEMMDKQDLVPANLYELLEYAKKDWNGEDWVVALGSPWQDPDGVCRVPCLCGGSGGRSLGLYWFVRGWAAGYRFAAVRKLSQIKYIKKELPAIKTCNQCHISPMHEARNKLYFCPRPDCPNFALMQVPVEELNIKISVDNAE